MFIKWPMVKLVSLYVVLLKVTISKKLSTVLLIYCVAFGQVLPAVHLGLSGVELVLLGI